MLNKKFLPNHDTVGYDAIRLGVISLIIFFVVFLVWAIFVPIQSASIADGVIVLDLNNKTIQHLEGGIIDDILVKEGQLVKEGDILLYIHDIKAKSEQQIYKKRLWAAKLQRERLLAQKNNKETLDLVKFFPELGVVDPEDKAALMEVINNQMQLFNSKTEELSGKIDVLRKKLVSVNAQKKASKSKLIIFRNELKAVKPLVKQGNLPVLRQYDLEKEIVNLEGEISQLEADSSSAKTQIANYANEDLSETLDKIKETELEIVNLSNQLESAKDVLLRSEIVAPVAGKIMNMKYYTVGAVVPPAGEIMNIVPQNDELIIEAKIKPQDIDEVRVGLKAKVALTAYKGNKVPKLDGEVLNVSANILNNEKTQESYFLARVKINQENLKKLKNKIELYPGMPAQVFIITGSRSLLSYLFTPIKDASYRAFREE